MQGCLCVGDLGGAIWEIWSGGVGIERVVWSGCDLAMAAFDDNVRLIEVVRVLAFRS